MRVKGSYDNLDGRKSFSIEFRFCNKDKDSSCEEKSKVQDLVKKLMITQYHLGE